jgi:hypothetical protein
MIANGISSANKGLGSTATNKLVKEYQKQGLSQMYTKGLINEAEFRQIAEKYGF